METSFNDLLRSLRRDRGLSQLELALESGCSQRHLSFLESGRSRPSRNLVLTLGEAMDVPLHQRNELLLAAGFAPFYSEFALSDRELAAVRAAIDQMLGTHQPYPAFAFDWRHDIIAANEAARELQLFLFDVDAPDDLPEYAGNLIRGCLHPDGFRRHIANWNDVANAMLRRFRTELLQLGRLDEGQPLLDEFAAHMGREGASLANISEKGPKPMLTIDIEKDGLSFSLFSILSTLGAPVDVTLQEIRIESFYPVDGKSAEFFGHQYRAWAPAA